MKDRQHVRKTKKQLTVHNTQHVTLQQKTDVDMWIKLSDIN